MATFIQMNPAENMGDLTLVLRMRNYPFIFSDEKKHKLKRHVLFWACWWIFFSTLYSFSAFILSVPYFTRLPMSAIESLFYMMPHMFLSYGIIYWVIPRFLLNGRYLVSIITVACLVLVTAAMSSVIGVYLLPHVRQALLGHVYIPPPHSNELDFFVGLLSGLRGSITIGGFAGTIKLMKYWYMKEQRNLELQKQNVEAQLQLLKAQVHPHFLFNTLNNIYSYTQPAAPVASKLVLGLSDMLRYMLYECNQSLVPLTKELAMLKDYMLLEKVRYDERLDLNTEFPDTAGDLFIAPLLLLPFIENAFKHGTSQSLEQPWISLAVTVENSRLHLKLLNGKNNDVSKARSSGIGITNVKKRLELLYPGRHELKISDDEYVFVVDLWIELERRNLDKVEHEKRVLTLAD